MDRDCDENHACAIASPTPSHTGRLKRVCVQAKIHGIARSVEMPPPALRLDGLDPMFMDPSSATGVAAWKYLHIVRLSSYVH